MAFTLRHPARFPPCLFLSNALLNEQFTTGQNTYFVEGSSSPVHSMEAPPLRQSGSPLSDIYVYQCACHTHVGRFSRWCNLG